MKKILLFLILILPIASALEFAPASLNFNLEQHEQQCQTVYFQLETEAEITNTWAENENIEWSVSKFTTPATQHGIQAQHSSQLAQQQTQTQVCLSGSNPGNYRGALVFKQEELGNSIIQFAVWLKVQITEKENTSSSSGSSKKSSGGSGGGSSSGQIYQSIQLASNVKEPTQTQEKPQTPEKINLNTPQKGEIQEQSPNPIYLTAIPIILLVILLTILLIPRKKH